MISKHLPRNSYGFLAVLLASTMWIAGCPETATTGDADTAEIDAAVDTGGDGEAQDVLADEGADVQPDDTATEPDYNDDYVPSQGGFLYPCDTNDECNSGFCIDGPEGKVCSKTCSNFCEVRGWSCRQDVSAAGVLFLCQPSFPTLCDPCRSNDDCVTDKDNTPHRCVPRGDSGAFCGGACKADDDCPDDYLCSTIVDIDGAVSSQCVTKEGAECSCSAGATIRGASTECSITVAEGKCLGERSCEEGTGLTACDAEQPQEEICNGVDDNCNDLVDETFQSVACPQTNPFGTCEGVTVCNGAAGESCNAPIPAEEVCDGVDNNCDGVIDEEGLTGCTEYYVDVDGDGFGVDGDTRCLCAPAAPYAATKIGDCDDGKAIVNPDATETCNGLDDDCDGTIDGGTANACIQFYSDVDGDGFGDPNDASCLCAPTGVYTTTDNTDCAPADGDISPAQSEICDGADNDCDGDTDEAGAGGCALFFADTDGDTYGNPADFACLCAAADPYVATQGGDCDDNEAALNPSLPETCGDSIDNDCDGDIDEANADGCVIYYGDNDNDGFGLIGDAQCLCAPVDPHDATEAGDCNDSNVDVKPMAAEICDGLDNNCDGVVDEPGTPGCTDYFLDTDGDTYGVGTSQCLCSPLGAFTASGAGDCDDTDPSAKPGNPEICNGKDDNCNGDTDEADAAGCTVYYIDVDDDDYGVASSGQCLCATAGDRTATQIGDCNDALNTVNPDVVEGCDAVDNDCDGGVDEGCGLPTIGWPTAGYDSRRTGHSMLTDVADTTPSVTWQQTLPTGGWSVRNSPVVTDNGDVIVSANTGIYRLAQADGSILSSAVLPAAIYPYAGPTLRTGGTVVVGAGSHLLLLSPSLEKLWDVDLGSTLVSTPIVDPNGVIYVVSASALHAVGSDGVQLWSETVTNNATTPSHPAIGINGRIYFTTSDHTVYAFDPAAAAGSRQVFASNPAPGPTEPVHGSVVISEIATIYAAFDQTIYGLSIAGTTVFSQDTGVTSRAGLAIHNTGFICCNPIEYVWMSAAGNAPLYRSSIDLIPAGNTGNVNKSGSARTSTLVFDRDGDVLVGSSNGLRAFAQSQADKWSFAPTGVGAVEGSVALDSGAVIFGDSNSTIYYAE